MSNKQTKTATLILPLLFGFFIMGFCDFVGVATSYFKEEFSVSETLAGFLPTMVFIWFLLLSAPVATAMNKWGRKKTVQISNIVTALGMLVPFVAFNKVTCLIGFALLGIGNTILQVSLNPLIASVVTGEKKTSTLNAGQVVKAVSSFCGPFIALFCSASLGSWKFSFLVFSILTVIAMLWLMFTPFEESAEKDKVSSIKETFSVLKNPFILLLFFGIVTVVGLDVGMNTVTPKLLIERCSDTVETAGLGSSVYFLCRTVGALIGTFLLARMTDRKYMLANAALAVVALIVLVFVRGRLGILVTVGAVGFLCSSLFSVIFSQAIKAVPEKTNEISGLMITGVCGGAIIPPVMGFLSDALGNQSGSIFVILVCAVYLFICGLSMKKANA